MLSPSLSQLLERARTRLGIEVEVLDATLQHVYPAPTTALARLIEQSPMVRQSLLEALADGRLELLGDAGAQYRVLPLRRASHTHKGSALVAVRQTGRSGESTDDRLAWTEVARAIVEADLAAADALTHERQQSRRLLATLRFLRHLVETETESGLAQAIVQAVAVWFDVEARIFRRHLDGGFVLHTSLPGARIEESSAALLNPELVRPGEAVRVASVPGWGASPGGAEVMVVPLSSGHAAHDLEWVLAIIGTLPAGTESLFESLGTIVGVQLDSIRARRRAATLARFDALLAEAGEAPELQAVRLVRELGDLTGAACASLVLHQNGEQRRLVCIGAAGEVPAELSALEEKFAPDHFVSKVPLGGDGFAVMELRARADAPFAPDGPMMVRTAISVLRPWLVGAMPSLRQSHEPTMSKFLRRIEEELARAKRFDLRLSLVVVDIPRTTFALETASAMQDAVRQELRGSDVLGTMDGHRLAALLTHTDDAGSHKVAGRLRRRLAEAAARFNVSDVRVGYAAFSADCRTTEALVSEAARNAQPVA